jgi:hypothetical protein
MAFFHFRETTMQTRPFELETDPPGAAPPEPGPAGHAPAAVRASRDGDDPEQRRDETLDEPGYGHGV